jgi:acyl carrier protein
MSRTPALETEVLDTVAAALGLERGTLSASVTAEQLGLDSLDLMKLTFTLERRFSVDLSGHGFEEVNSMEKLIALLAARLPDEKRRSTGP